MDRVRSSAFAGQVGEKDSETLFGLRGSVSHLEVIDTELSLFPKATRATTCFKPDGNRLDHTVESKKAGNWEIASQYVYGYNDAGVRTGPKFYRSAGAGKALALDHYVMFEYEANGIRRSIQRQFAADGTLTFTQRFSYDAQGRRVAIQWVLPDQQILRTYLFSYSSVAGLSIKAQRGRGLRDRFSFFIWELSGKRFSIELRQNRWSLPSVTVAFFVGMDGHRNYTRSIAIKAYGLKRVVPMVAVIIRKRSVRYFQSVSAPEQRQYSAGR